MAIFPCVSVIFIGAQIYSQMMPTEFCKHIITSQHLMDMTVRAYAQTNKPVEHNDKGTMAAATKWKNKKKKHLTITVQTISFLAFFFVLLKTQQYSHKNIIKIFVLFCCCCCSRSSYAILFCGTP